MIDGDPDVSKRAEGSESGDAGQKTSRKKVQAYNIRSSASVAS